MRGAVVVGVLLMMLCWSGHAPADPAPARAWKYIVIHHSATRTGSAEVFDANHRSRGMVNGLAYHFVINNGSGRTVDGRIETGARWARQLHGGHCRQDEINEQGIGICLVGDFTRDQPSARQLQALALLVRGLQYQFDISDEDVVGHGDIIGEYSECPGQSFPWTRFRQQLSKLPK
jgi:N-acetyl-anhydromuramyl-L-alanine amidase AmpD